MLFFFVIIEKTDSLAERGKRLTSHENNETWRFTVTNATKQKQNKNFDI